MTAIEQLRVKVQAWADKNHDPPTQKWPAWKVLPAEILALIDVAEAAQQVDGWHQDPGQDGAWPGYWDKTRVDNLSAALERLKKLPQKLEED